MCGISGILNLSPRANGSLERAATTMNNSLYHRGPDDNGLWVDEATGLAFAHRRLSIVDLSPAGHQPMISSDGRFVMVYNGEVYNHEDIRPELTARGVVFRGHSDTEVILEAFSALGIEATVKRLVGMFAIALWDRRERTLTLIRDRIGIKPLYWAKFGSLFLFGSELKALLAHNDWFPQIDRSALAAYMRHNYIPAPHSVFKGVMKLEPGSILTLRWEDQPVITKYWDARAVVRAGVANPLLISDHEILEQLETLLIDAVHRRMVADVPVGAFLSGGIDSSLVVALMQAANAGPVRTYTIGFDIPDYDEAKHAAAVAHHLNTEHTELILTSNQALEVIPNLPDYYDEPFADSSQIPTYLVSAMTRQHVTVALSGDGGDELFGGYNRYQLAQNYWRTLSSLPLSARHVFALGIRSLSPKQWTNLFNFLPTSLRPPMAGDKMHKLASVLELEEPGALYRRLCSHWEPDSVMLHAEEPKGALWDATIAHEFPDLLGRMQFLDLITYLPDDILTKVDRASMAASLEARVPLIDHRLVEFSWRLPRSKLIREGLSKWPLRQILYKHVPAKLIERPKMGFGIPLGEWLRGPLREWSENLLSHKRLHEEGYFNPTIVRRAWTEHLSGERNWQYPLWNVLMFEAWLDRWSHKIH